MKDVTKISTMLDIQGDQVLAVYNKETLLLTIVRFVDFDSNKLLLVERGSKHRDEWPLLQELADALTPFTDPKIPALKWKLNLDAPVAQC